MSIIGAKLNHKQRNVIHKYKHFGTYLYKFVLTKNLHIIDI